MTVRSYFLPASLPEALELLGRHGQELLVMAGGTVAMPLVNEGLSLPEAVMGLRRVGLDGIERRDGTLRIGATATLTQLLEQGDVPLLAEAARNTASWAVRNMATVGGNLFTPPPGGDISVALLALDAVVVIAGPNGERTVPLETFFTGFMTTALAPDELVVAVDVPAIAGSTAFTKFARKHGNSPAVVTVAAHVTQAGDAVAEARIALGAVGPHPIRARAAERALAGAALTVATIETAAAEAARECEPFTDAIASDWYRRRMTGVVVTRTLERLAGAATPEDRRS